MKTAGAIADMKEVATKKVITNTLPFMRLKDKVKYSDADRLRSAFAIGLRNHPSNTGDGGLKGTVDIDYFFHPDDNVWLPWKDAVIAQKPLIEHLASVSA